MSAKYGVNYTISTEAARPISVESVTPVAIVGTASSFNAGLHFYGSVTKAKDLFESDSTKGAGSIRQALNAMFMQSVETPVILSIFDETEDEAANISAAKQAVAALSKAEALTGYRPNIIIAPGLSEVGTDMLGIAETLKAIAVIDLGAEDETQALEKSKNYGSKRAVLCDPYVKIWDIYAKKEAFAPMSPFVAAMIARTDAESEYGFSDSFSNRTINGISGLARPVDFNIGEDCEADRLRAAGITTVIRYDGFRLWGGETMDNDAIWNDLARVRTFDRIAEACQKGVFYAVDRKASQLYHAKRSVEELLRNLTGSRVLIGYDVSWSKDKNTVATVTQGKFYLDIKMQNNPIVKTIMLGFAYVDDYSDKLLSEINN